MNPEVIQKRDRRLRRRLLEALYESRVSPMGGIGGRTAVDVIDSAMPEDQRFDNDDHALALLIDLRDGGYVEMLDRRTRKLQRWCVDYMFLKITDKGSRLIREEIPVDPAIEDERL
jgi:hypothetical protein